jgi:Transposase DDE domain
MIISENIEKVKRKALRLINKTGTRLSKPEKKFTLEMVMGMIISGSSNISEIARTLKELTAVKQTTKRFGRMLTHDHILGVCNQLCLEESVSKIDDHTIIALDEGDTTHRYGEKFELLNTVRDGSSGEFEKGYRLNQISGYNPRGHETFPIALDIYSTKEKGHKSTNAQTLNLVSSTLDLIGTHGLWVMDRGYDNGVILDYFMQRSLNFAVRMNTGSTSRNVIVDGKSINIVDVAKTINRRVTFDKNCRFGTLKIELKPKYRKYPATLICFNDKRNKEPILLLTSGWQKSTRELKRRIKGYFRRWGIEESYRFEKQGFGIEKATVRKFSRIQTLIGLTLLSWLLLTKINEAPKLKKVVLKQAKMEKNKPKHQPKFIYYRLLKGVQNLFKGAVELFRFRWRKKRKELYRKEVKKQRLLFPQMHPNLSWMEFPG